MLGHSGRGRDRRDDRRQCASIISSTATSSTCALDLTAGRRGLAALAEVDARAGSRICSASKSTIEPLTELRDAKFTWYVGLDAEGTRIGDALWNGEELDEATTRARGRAVPADLPRSRRRDRTRCGGEPVYLILAMTGGQAAALQAAESRDRPADPASGGGDMSSRTRRAFRSASWSSAARPRRHGSISLARRSRCCTACRSTTPWTVLREDDDATTFYAGAPRSSCIDRETGALSRQSCDRRSVALGGVAPDRAPSRPTSLSR